jgi:competence protein ComEA
LLSSRNTAPQVIVEVAGAVKEPGIYTLEHGSRVGQALALAGNILESADVEYTTKQLNLAQPVTDGDKVYIPFYTEKINKVDSPSNSASEKNTGDDAQNQSASGKTSINDASKSVLVGLPGIGDKRADAIIESRPYQSLTQLVEQEIVTQKIFDDIKNLISL